MSDNRPQRQDEGVSRILSSLSPNTSNISNTKLDRLVRETNKAICATDRKRPRIEQAGSSLLSSDQNDDHEWQVPKRPIKSQRINPPGNPDEGLTKFPTIQISRTKSPRSDRRPYTPPILILRQ
ncbi:hypothetical protein TKK_0005006 [Trichogramma kaykai]